MTVTNEDGQTFSRNVTYQTRYLRIERHVPGSGQPTAVTRTTPFLAPPSSTVYIYPPDVFDSVGTNAVFTEVTFSPTNAPSDYYTESKILDRPGTHYHGAIKLTVKSNRQLNALPSPPSDSFDVTATLTMTNDEEQTATATLTIGTQYLRDET